MGTVIYSMLFIEFVVLIESSSAIYRSFGGGDFNNAVEGGDIYYKFLRYATCEFYNACGMRN